jgi:hypothetical protein
MASGASVVSTVAGAWDADTQGIYILNSDLTPDGGTTVSAYATGNSVAGYGAAGSSALYRPHIDPSEGKLWIGSYSDGYEWIKQGDDQFSAGSIHTPMDPADSWGVSNQLGVCSYGTGGSRVIYGCDEDLDLSACGFKDLVRFDVGTVDDNYDTTPALVVPACGIGSSTFLYHLRDLDIMSSGTIFVGNYRWGNTDIGNCVYSNCCCLFR